MCGICGKFILNSGVPPELSSVLLMNKELEHRGPDDSGHYIDSDVCLAMRRLAIISPQSNRQPLHEEAAKIALVFNGEIYNFRELKEELSAEGVNLAGTGDTEVILQSYKVWGIDFIQKLNGMFAFALWDYDKKILLLARDPFGQKPLFYTTQGKEFIFASELSCFAVLQKEEIPLNHGAFFQLANLDFIASPETVYKEIHSLNGGEYLVVNKTGEMSLKRWWHLDFVPKKRDSRNELMRQCQEILDKAVERCLIADRPLGIFLSGGLDSSIITCIAKRKVKYPLNTFSISLENERLSEEKFSDLVSEHFGTTHMSVLFTAKDFQDSAEECISRLDQPLSDAALIPLFHLCKIVTKKIKVALCGDGGDETMAGYSRYLADLYGGFVPPILAGMAIALGGMFKLRDRAAASDYNLWHALERISANEKSLRHISYLKWKTNYRPAFWFDLFRSEFKSLIKPNDISNTFQSFDRSLSSRSRLDRVMSQDHQFYLQSDLLPKTDRASMLNGLEMRAPFLDTEWVQWCAKIPDNFKIRGLATKYILRESFRKSLPGDIAVRQKRGFNLPLAEWLKGELSSWAEEKILSANRLYEIFDRDKIKNLLVRMYKDEACNPAIIWPLIVISIWMEKKSAI